MDQAAIASSTMDHQSQLVHDSNFPSEGWVDMNSYNQMAMSGYGTDYYVSPMAHGLPAESIGMHPPPIPPQLHHNPYANQLPPSLGIPLQPRPGPVTWPSMQTNPGQGYSTPTLTMPAKGASLRGTRQRLPSLTTSSPRKTLTDDDRRRMCQFAEDNPSIKQTEIGHRFGVERSTVSKVLQKKDQYLYQRERNGSSPVRRVKGKSPDIERSLANWVRNQLKKGHLVDDSEMERQAVVFLEHGGSAGGDSTLKNITPSWLEKFKQKHGIGPGKLIRRASETAIPDSAEKANDSSTSASQTLGKLSPVSPADESSPTAGDEATSFVDFGSAPFKPINSRSTNSLPTPASDPPSATFSSNSFSPTSQFTFSPDPNLGLFDQCQLAPGGAEFHRPRSQTLPMLDLGYPKPEPLTPKYSAPITGPSSALSSPAHELPAPAFGLSPKTISNDSNSSLGARSVNTPIMPGSSPSSPTQDDARRAADTLLNFMSHNSGHSSLVSSEDWYAVMRLTEKLKPQPAPKPMAGCVGIGGLSRIPEGDSEMPNITQTMVKSEMMSG